MNVPMTKNCYNEKSLDLKKTTEKTDGKKQTTKKTDKITPKNFFAVMVKIVAQKS